MEKMILNQKKEHLEFLKMWCNMKGLQIGCWKRDLL